MFDSSLTGVKQGYSRFSEPESGQKSMIFCGKFVDPLLPPPLTDGFVSGPDAFLPVLNVARLV